MQKIYLQKMYMQKIYLQKMYMQKIYMRTYRDICDRINKFLCKLQIIISYRML